MVIEDLDDGLGRTEYILIEGEAMGADIIAAVVVELEMDDGPEFSYDDVWVDIERYPAEWRVNGEFRRNAGPVRNQQMLDTGVDYVVGFHNDIESSRGTRDMLRRCARAGIPGRLFTEESEVEEWQSLVNS